MKTLDTDSYQAGIDDTMRVMAGALGLPLDTNITTIISRIAQLNQAIPITRRLVRWADKTVDNFPKSATIAGQNARVMGGMWLAEIDPTKTNS